MEIINKIKNSCNGNRGCSVRIILPHDSRVITTFSKMSRRGDDIQKILPFTNSFLDKVA